MKFREVYHSSKVQGLRQIIPQKNIHRGDRVCIYAAWDIVMSVVSLVDIGCVFFCTVGRDSETGKPFICERFKGAFDLRYGNVKGSIYVLPGEEFIEDKTKEREEVVCEVTVIPLREIRIDNVKKHLLQLVEENELIVKYYPKRIAGIPEDDEDLVHRAVSLIKQKIRPVDEVLGRIKKYHPNLLDRVLQAIEKGKY